VRANFAQSSASWDKLTENEREAWRVAAAQRKSKARLGTSGALTGNQFFVQVNQVLATFGLDAVTAPPVATSFSSLAPQNMVLTNPSGVVAINLTVPSAPGEITFLRGSAPVKPGVNRVPAMKLLGACPVPTSGHSNITALYEGVFGAPAAGQRIFVEGFTVENGLESPGIVFTGVVPAAV
jgi:hypothetical protein